MNYREIYNRYLNDTNKSSAQEMIDILNGKEDQHFKYKLALIKHVFNFNNITSILDVGSSGFFTSLLLQTLPQVQYATAIDGDYDNIKALQPFIDKRIHQIYHNFYDKPFPEIHQHHLALHIDFPEHLPDDLYTEIFNWTMKYVSGIYIYTPEYPLASDQYEHISVKTRQYFENLFSNYKYNMLVYNNRIFAVVKSS